MSQCLSYNHATLNYKFQTIDKIIPFRLTEHEELLGADYTEHNVHHPGVGVTRAVSVLKKHDEKVDLNLVPVGKNKGHMDFLERVYATKLRNSGSRNKC